MSVPFINEAGELEQASPELMDRCWSEGWRHFGSYFFRYSRMSEARGFKTITPLRMRLEDFELSTSQARVMKRNANLELRIQDASIDLEKCNLFTLHSQRFSENVPDSLYSFLGFQPATVPCQTKELALFKEGRLIGVTFLDIGANSSSSIYSIYDPFESKHSLGVYLILCSIKYSIALGKTFYYPGYATLEPSVYDYKKRFSALEYFDWNGNWYELFKV
jgi:leucyl-tRNA---protein transferase